MKTHPITQHEISIIREIIREASGSIIEEITQKPIGKATQNEVADYSPEHLDRRTFAKLAVLKKMEKILYWPDEDIHLKVDDTE